ncbi:MAG: hypothetical protein KBS59_02610, partial [Clostridiales bacterium]|nr:hypothetical protein [Clostridiales bacterium]
MKNNILTPLQSALVCAATCYSLLECAGGDAVSALFCLIPAALCFFGLLTDGGAPLSSAVRRGIWFFAVLSLSGTAILSVYAGKTAARYYENVPEYVFAI